MEKPIYQSNILVIKIILLTILFVLIGIVFWGMITITNQRNSLTANSTILNNLSMYEKESQQDLSRLISHNTPKTFSSLDGLSNNLSGQLITLTNQFNEIQAPYLYFLQFIYLPSLNIWKNHLTDTLDLNLIGEKFLNNNPFLDSVRFLFWSNFFKNVSNVLPYNEIKNITISDINDQGSGFYSYTVNVEFISPNKRTFLMLLNRLSLTSDLGNISLINNFFYTIWQTIKEKHSLSDQEIGHKLSQRMYGENNGIINDDIIIRAMGMIGHCSDNDNREHCLYKFREKMRNIPDIAYTIGQKSSTGLSEQLRTYLLSMPPVITIDQFNFTTNKAKNNVGNTTYAGTVNIRVYGKSIQPEEIDEISTALGRKCFGSGSDGLTPSITLGVLDQILSNIGTDSSIPPDQTKKFLDLQTSLKTIHLQYNGLNAYKKIIKLFEIWRMLSDYGICTQH